MLVVKFRRDLRWGTFKYMMDIWTKHGTPINTKHYIFLTFWPQKYLNISMPKLPFRELTYPTLRKGKIIFKMPFLLEYVPWRVHPCQVTAYAQVNMVISAALKPPIWVTASCANRFMITSDFRQAFLCDLGDPHLAGCFNYGQKWSWTMKSWLFYRDSYI